jgi:hypothetical protein
LHRFAATGRRRWLLLFGASWLLQSLSNGYFLFYFGVLAACWIIWFLHGRSWRAVVWVVGAWAAASLPLVPLLLSYERIQGAFGLHRGFNEIRQFSAGIESLFTTTSDVLLHHGWPTPEGELYPGALALGLPLAAVVVTWWRRRGTAALSRAAIVRNVCLGIALVFAVVAAGAVVTGPWQVALLRMKLAPAGGGGKPMTVAAAALTLALLATAAFQRAFRERSVFGFYVGASALMFALALGPQPSFRGESVMHYGPYWLLMQLPGLSGLRAPARFGALLSLCLATAGGVGFSRLRLERSALRVAATAAAMSVTVAEIWMPTMPLAAAPARIPALERAGTAGVPVLELPVGSPQSDLAALARIPMHHRPVINGYSGYAPPHQAILRVGLTLDDSDVLAELARDQAITIAVDHRQEFDRWSRLVARLNPDLVDDDGVWRVYRVAAQPRPATGPSGDRLAVASVTANVGPDWVGRMLDGDLNTEWNSRRVQAGGEEVAIDLGADRDVSGVSMSLGPFTFDFPRRLVVDCASGSGAWQECWRGSTTALAMRAVLTDEGNPVITIPIERAAVRRLRLRQTAVDPRNGWSIAELAVFGR